MAEPLRLVHVEPEITAGGYLKLRREAAGVAGLLVGLALAGEAKALAAGRRYADAEADRCILTPDELRIVRNHFAFDADVYLRLTQGLPLSAICRGCGCTWLDACEEPIGDGRTAGCAWTPGDPTLCTACDRKGRG